MLFVGDRYIAVEFALPEMRKRAEQANLKLCIGKGIHWKQGDINYSELPDLGSGENFDWAYI